MRIRRTVTLAIVVELLCGGPIGIDALAAPPGTTNGVATPGEAGTDGRAAKAATVMSGMLLDLAAAYGLGQPQGRPAVRRADPRVQIVEGRVIVEAIAAGDTGRLQADLAALGARNVVGVGRVVSAEVPLRRLGDLPGLASLHWVRPALRPWPRPALPSTPAGARARPATDQGAVAMRADVARMRFGVDGSGVTVGVISDSFNCRGGAAPDADVASGALPPGVVVLAEGPCSDPDMPDEGRAMMQLIHFVAPGARLMFHAARDTPRFAAGIGELVMAGANIIVDDVREAGEPFLQDGIIAQAAQAAVDMGVPYFSAAGNEGAQSYESRFRDSGELGPTNGTLHDFDPGDGGDTTQHIRVPVGGGIAIELQWAQPFFSVSGPPGATSDINIFLVNARGEILDQSAEPNIGKDPIEAGIEFENDGHIDVDGVPGPDERFGIRIERAAGPAPGLLKYTWGGSSGTEILEHDTHSSTLVGHANAAGVMAVAAASYDNTPAFGVAPPVRQDDSSRGGTPILFSPTGTPVNERRSKPEITAPDNTNTTFFGCGDVEPDGLLNFCGTSAAAPHAAAVAALLLQANPSLTPAQVYEALEQSAIDMGPPGFDLDSGVGLIQADAALAAIFRCMPGGCDDGNPCTDDVCDPGTGCQHAPNTGACSDGTECTVADRCGGGQCQPGARVTPGTVSTLVTGGLDGSRAACRSDERRRVRQVVTPLRQAAQAFARAERAGVGSQKWTRRMAVGERKIRTARSKLTRLEARLSPACAGQLGDAIATGALGEACLR
jgi:subtilisin family serine protease